MPVDRISLTVDPDLGKAAREAAEADGVSLSAWISEAMADRVRLRMLGEAIDAFEAEYGEFTEDEIAAAEAFMQDAEREVQEKLREHGSAA